MSDADVQIQWTHYDCPGMGTACSQNCTLSQFVFGGIKSASNKGVLQLRHTHNKLPHQRTKQLQQLKVRLQSVALFQGLHRPQNGLQSSTKSFCAVAGGDSCCDCEQC